MDEAHRVREFWFGRLPLSADALNRRLHFWFAGPPSELGRLRDEHIRERFGELLELAASGALASWEDGPRRRLSLILLLDRKSTRLNSSHLVISYAVFCLKKKKNHSTRSCAL